MSATFRKDPNLKYTDMCIYIDAHMKDVLVEGQNKQIEDNIIQYIYNVMYVLACKKNFFKNFDDYDEFALYSAGELFVALRNRYLNAGKTIRGKQVVPIKSCLNFMKSVLFPLKVNYQKQNYATVLNPDIDENFAGLEGQYREDIRSKYRASMEVDLAEFLKNLPNKIHNILLSTPYKNNEFLLKKFEISCILTFINDVTIPNKLKNKLDKKIKDVSKDKMISVYKTNETNVILWHLDSKFAGYVRILVVKIKRAFTDELINYRSSCELSEEMIDNITKTAYITYDQDREDY